jgi:hypothetical protein
MRRPALVDRCAGRRRGVRRSTVNAGDREPSGAVLYGVASSDGRFGCIESHPNRPEHHCMNLAYATEADDRTGRLWRKQRKLEAHLLENRTGTRYVKPKGMHWRTFNALCNRIAAVEEAKDAAFFEGAARMLARYCWPGDLP